MLLQIRVERYTKWGLSVNNNITHYLYMENKNFAFGKINFILIAVGVLIVIFGFILMSGSASTEASFNADVFSVRRIKVAPVVSFFGFIFIIYAIMKKPKSIQSIEKKVEDKTEK